MGIGGVGLMQFPRYGRSIPNTGVRSNDQFQEAYTKDSKPRLTWFKLKQLGSPRTPDVRTNIVDYIPGALFQGSGYLRATGQALDSDLS